MNRSCVRRGVLWVVLCVGAPSVGMPWARVAPAGEPAGPAASIVRVADGKLQIGLDSVDGALCELRDLRSGADLLESRASPELWRIKVRTGDAAHELAARQAGRPSIERVDDNAAAVRLVWPKVEIGGGESLRVEVRATLGAQQQALSRWELSIAKPSSVRIAEIRFPRLGHLRERTEERLAVPRQMGVLTRHVRRLTRGPDGLGRRLTWHSPQGNDLSIPCLALYAADGPGFYAACDDTEGFCKQLALEGDAKGRLLFEVLHTPEQQAAGKTEFKLPFGVVMGAFHGDWNAAAEIYRDSPAARSIAQRGRLRRGVTPEWLPETGLWLWNRGRSSEVLDPARVLREHVDAPVSVLWHWWHDCAYDIGFPEFFPPRDGATPFRAALAAAQARGIHAILYMNQRLWGTTTRSWTAERAETYAVKHADGAIRPEVYNPFVKAPCAPMCVSTPFWREKYAGMAREALVNLGAGGLYMDQAGVWADCYDPSHGHAPGPGRYWSAGLAQLAGQIRDRTADRRPVVLAGEYCGEPWIGVLDLQLALCVSHDRIGMGGDWEPIPFYPAVYHTSTILFGSLAGLVHPPYDERWPAATRPANCLTLLDPRFSKQFYLDHARSFAWGLQPMLANFQPSHLVERREEMDFVARMVRIRRQSQKYLVCGQWVRPPKFDVPQREIDVAQLGVYTPLRASKRTCPAVVSGAWRAADGDIGVALASIDDAPLSLRLRVDPIQYELPARCAVYCRDHTGRRRIGTLLRENPVWTLTLPARGICVIEFNPRGTPIDDSAAPVTPR